jgi:hypothetical protein
MLFSNISSSGGTPALISGIPGSLIEDLKFSDIFFQQSGGGTPESAALQPPENESKYPDPEMFGQLPASGFFMRHIRNVEMSNIEIATDSPDARPAFWLYDVQGADFFRVRTPHASESSPSTSSPAPAFALKEVANFRHFGSQFIPDYTNPKIDRHQF